MSSWHREKRGHREVFSASEKSFVRAAHDPFAYRLLESSFYSHIWKLQSNSLAMKKRTNEKLSWWTADNLHHIFYSNFLILYFYALKRKLLLLSLQTSNLQKWTGFIEKADTIRWGMFLMRYSRWDVYSQMREAIYFPPSELSLSSGTFSPSLITG